MAENMMIRARFTGEVGYPLRVKQAAGWRA
jgi:hypothetical protein